MAQHGVIGEEFGWSGGDSHFTWVIDPIDGTKSFVSGVPLYSTLLALLDDDEPVLGIVYEPPLHDMIYATRGGGCFWNGRRVRTSRVPQLSDAILLASDLDGFGPTGKTDAWNRLVESTYIQRTWGDAYGYALVATGRAEIMVDPIVALWDIAPLQVILEEAGRHTDRLGRPARHSYHSGRRHQRRVVRCCHEGHSGTVRVDHTRHSLNLNDSAPQRRHGVGSLRLGYLLRMEALNDPGDAVGRGRGWRRHHRFIRYSPATAGDR